MANLTTSAPITAYPYLVNLPVLAATLSLFSILHSLTIPCLSYFSLPLSFSSPTPNCRTTLPMVILLPLALTPPSHYYH